MKGNKQIEFFENTLGLKINYIKLPKLLFENLIPPDNLILISPIMPDNIIEDDLGLLTVLPSIPLIFGKVISNTCGYEEGDVVMFNKAYVSFVYYRCIETDELLIGATKDLILFKAEEKLNERNESN